MKRWGALSGPQSINRGVSPPQRLLTVNHLLTVFTPSSLLSRFSDLTISQSRLTSH
ncbi:hypothetical protein Syun_019461 [Stephania yunnanensis]|uniref:Uncharacterized protein n=1 Tax=Stephania yunnanensis TaxID=152371 RepID=A0AAP0IU81_9MAGN